MKRRALTVQEIVCAHTHPTLQDAATTRIRARVYRSRYPTLRTVRITGSGEVWVDGTRRACVASDGGLLTAAEYPWAGERFPVVIRSLLGMADAMEVVR